MKKKSNYRTPKRLLSLVLSSLLLLSCFSVLSGVFVLEAGAAGSTAVSSYYCIASGYWEDASTLTVSGVEDSVDNVFTDSPYNALWTVHHSGVRNGDPKEHDAATAYKYVDYRLNKTISSLGITLNLNNTKAKAIGQYLGVALHADSYGNYDVGPHSSYYSKNYSGYTDLTYPLEGGDLPSVGTKTVNVTSYHLASGPEGYGHDHYNRAVINIVVHDTTNLYNEVNAASTKNALSNGASYYSPSSWNTFKDCYDDAVARITNTRDQSVIDAACNNLVNARNALKPSFSIQYRNANGEAFGAPVSYAYSNTTATLRTDYPEKTGYTFAGWSFGGTTYPTSQVAHHFGGTADGGIIDMTAAYVPNTYNVNYSLGAGVSKASETAATIQHGSTATVKLTVDPAYSQRTPAPIVTNGTLTYVSKSGTTYTYNLKGVTADTTVTVPALAKNQYTVTVPSSGTGFTASKSGTVTHGENYTFTVKLLDGYTQTLPTVKAGTVTLGATPIGNNTYSYTITGVKSDTSVSINGVAVNTYSVGYSLGAGVSKGSGTATKINHFGTATVKLTVAPEYSQRTPAPIVTNGTLSEGKRTGNNIEYTLSGVTANTTVTVPALALNQYTVTIPAGAGYSLDATSKDVTHGETTTFTVTLDAAHNQNAPVAKIDGKALTYTKNGDSYTFTTGAITANKTVEIGNVQINKYQYTLPTGTGFTVKNAAGMDCTSITHGNDYSFVVSVKKEYTQTVPTVTLKDGTVLTADSAEFVGGDEKGDKVYTYTVKNVTDHNKITVAAMSMNTYSAVLPYDKTAEASYKVTNTKADANNVVSGIVYGSDLTFGVALDAQYNRSTVVVKYNDSVLTPDEGGLYTIENITQDITEGKIVVEGVELNHYYITLPLETETGFVIEVGKGLNAKSVLSRTDFNFKFFLDPAYSDSTPTIKVSRDGGDHYSVLTKADGKYTIENVLSDCIVVVEGVKKNTYTVKFVDEGGNVLEEKKGVEYGSDVKYTGDTPTKATEKVSETTDAAGNTVLVERKYKFIGWSADTSYVTSNMEVTPIFEVTEVTTTKPADGGASEVVVTKKTANILFISDEVIIHKDTVEKGESFSGWTEVPVKTSSNPYETYEFLGWDIDKDGHVDYNAGESNAIADVQDDVTFVAVFKSNLPAQTVNFYNFDGSKLLYTASVKRGERANYGLSSIPSRTDKAYEYTFEGWSYDTYADETTVLDKIVVGENDINVYAAYSKEVINYTYKYINDGTVLKKGEYNFVDGKPTDYKYTGETPTRASSKSTDYTFDGWLATTPSRYSTEYVATYTESVRNYDYALPETDGTYAIALDEAVGEKLPYGGKLIFTITLDEGYTQTPPVVKSNGETLEYEMSGENSYVFTIVADGADADEIKDKLNKITVETAINHYDVTIGKADGADISSEGFNTEYNGEGTFTVTLKESHNQTAPVVAAAEDDRVVVTLVSKDGDVYTYKVSEIKSDATITVTTKINEYKVVMTNLKDDDYVFNGYVKHGEAPVYTNPGKPTDANGKYVFIGWDTDVDGNFDGKVDVTAIANVTGDINAKAVYKYDHEHTSDPSDPDSVWLLVKTDKASCFKDGMKYYVCKHCGEQTKEVVIPAREHKYGEYTVTLAPTCTTEGSKVRYCVNAETDDYAKCNHSETEVVEKLGHAYGEWKTIVEPTCTEKGKAERVCANDPSHKEYKDIPATGHHDSDGDYICDDCGVNLGHCSKCICHKGNVLSKVQRYICTLLTKILHKPIKCCSDMEWYGDEPSSIS